MFTPECVFCSTLPRKPFHPQSLALPMQQELYKLLVAQSVVQCVAQSNPFVAQLCAQPPIKSLVLSPITFYCGPKFNEIESVEHDGMLAAKQRIMSTTSGPNVSSALNTALVGLVTSLMLATTHLLFVVDRPVPSKEPIEKAPVLVNTTIVQLSTKPSQEDGSSLAAVYNAPRATSTTASAADTWSSTVNDAASECGVVAFRNAQASVVISLDERGVASHLKLDSPLFGGPEIEQCLQEKIDAFVKTQNSYQRTKVVVQITAQPYIDSQHNR